MANKSYHTSCHHDPFLPVIQFESDNIEAILIEKVIMKVVEIAEESRRLSALDGKWTDGYCTHKMEIVQAFCYGWNHLLLPKWNKLAKDIIRESDEEWVEYLRLKEKFKEYDVG